MGALIRHSAGSITIMIGVVLLPLVLALFMFSDALSGVRQFLMEYSIPSQLSAFYGVSVVELRAERLGAAVDHHRDHRARARRRVPARSTRRDV